MIIALRLTSALTDVIRRDLQRPHEFAVERIGFVVAGAAPTARGIVVLGRSYAPVADADYIDDPTVGARIGSNAFRAAFQWAMQNGAGLYHVHLHHGRGVPLFSRTDLEETFRFAPSFFNAVPSMPHGAVVLSEDSGKALVWSGPDAHPQEVSPIVEIAPGRRAA